MLDQLHVVRKRQARTTCMVIWSLFCLKCMSILTSINSMYFCWYISIITINKHNYHLKDYPPVLASTRQLTCCCILKTESLGFFSAKLHESFESERAIWKNNFQQVGCFLIRLSEAKEKVKHAE